jgi:hypothetical protein
MDGGDLVLTSSSSGCDPKATSKSVADPDLRSSCFDTMVEISKSS